MAMQHSLPIARREPGAPLPRKMFGFGPGAMAVRQLGPEIDAFLSRREIMLDTASRQLLASAAATAIADARRQLERMADGNYTPDPQAQRFPPLETTRSEDKRVYTIDQLLERWEQMTKPAPKTFKRWSGVMRAMSKVIGKDNILDITEADMQIWCDHRVTAGISPATIANADLAGPRILFNWARTDLVVQLPANPAAKVRIKVRQKEVLRQRGYELTEAVKILSATFDPTPDRYLTTSTAARRWVPWLCSYSGARVGEIAQMRAEDIFCKDAGLPIWCMRITPEAGTQKTQTARVVPIHSHVIDQGFLRYVASREGKPLFYEPSRRRGGSEANRQCDKVGERLAAWIRLLGITDKAIQPNHAWRHRFRTIGRTLRIQDSMLNALDGHVAASIADAYGDFELLAKKWVIERFPRYRVVGDPSNGTGNPFAVPDVPGLPPAFTQLLASKEEDS